MTATGRTIVARAGLDRIALGAIAVLMLPVGLEGALFPHHFFWEFPFGRGWLAVDGVYNEHLAGGVGSLYLSLAVATLFALRARLLVRPIAAGWLVQGTLHVGYHFRYLHLYDAPIDEIGVIVTLLAIPILAAVALVANTGIPYAHHAPSGTAARQSSATNRTLGQGSATAAERGTLQDVDAAHGTQTDDMGEPNLGVLDLALAGLAAEMGRDLVHIGDAGSADRVALADETA